jgi:hypothetical protein
VGFLILNFSRFDAEKYKNCLNKHTNVRYSTHFSSSKNPQRMFFGIKLANYSQASKKSCEFGVILDGY